MQSQAAGDGLVTAAMLGFGRSPVPRMSGDSVLELQGLRLGVQAMYPGSLAARGF